MRNSLAIHFNDIVVSARKRSWHGSNLPPNYKSLNSEDLLG